MSRFAHKNAATMVAVMACFGASGAQAQTPGQLQVVAQVLQRNVVEQQHIAAALAHGRIDLPDASLMLAREGHLYQRQAKAFEMGASGAELRGIVEMQVALQQTQQRRHTLGGEHPAMAGSQDAHQQDLMVLALRGAAAQRSLAHDWASGGLTLAQLGHLEQVQAEAIVAAAD